MKRLKLATLALLGMLIATGFACGGGQGAESTSTPTSTAVPTATVEATPTATVSGCPLPGEGKGNIAGLLVWNGKPWENEFDTVTILKLYSLDVLVDKGDWIDTEGNCTAAITTALDGSFCFHDIEPGEYRIHYFCPTGYNRSGCFAHPIKVTEGKTYWLGVDPYDCCTSPRD